MTKTKARNHSPKKYLVAIALSILGIFALKKLYLTSMQGSSDLEVFWRSAQALWSGTNPYLPLGDDRGFVFKYHPGVLALFLPFAAISLPLCKALWVGVEVGTLYYAARWLTRNGIRPGILLSTTALFWYLWFEHFKYGQIMLPLLALCLWAMTPRVARSNWRNSLLLFVMSIKVFSIYALVGCGKKIFSLRTFLGAFLIVVSTHLVLGILLLKNTLNPLTEIPTFYRNWLENAMHSARDLGLNNVRGTVNHGFPATLLRRIDPLALNPHWDTPVSLAVALLLGALWWRASRKFCFEKKWVGWLALSAVAHPLAWSHSYVFVYPLAAFALQGAWDLRAKNGVRKPLPLLNRILRPACILACLAGIGMMGLWVPQVVGLDRAILVEQWGNKAWGALICAWVLIFCENSAATAQAKT